MNGVTHGLVMSEAFSEEELINAIAEAESELWQDDARGGDGYVYEHLALLKEELREREQR